MSSGCHFFYFLQKIYLSKKSACFLITYYHTIFQDPTSSGTNVTHISEVFMATIFVLLLAGNSESLKLRWYDVQTKFHEHLSTGAKITGRGGRQENVTIVEAGKGGDCLYITAATNGPTVHPPDDT
jgi:hypothetical protein